MNVVTEVGKHKGNSSPPVPAKPEMAIVFYGKPNEKGVALVRHAIDDNGQFGIGELLASDAALRDVQGALASQAGHSNSADELIPDNLLLDNGRALVWHVPRRVAPLWFKGRPGGKTEQLRVEWPAMIMAVRKDTREFHLYAVGTNRRPSGNTPVYKLPMFNVYDGGKVCQGNATIPATLERDSYEAVASCFIDAFKTHTNDRGLFRPATLKALDATESCTRTLYRYWKQKAAEQGQQPERVRMSELVPVGRLKELLPRLA